ncbi:hypothetical protein D3C71_853490 [compost metagenome]
MKLPAFLFAGRSGPDSRVACFTARRTFQRQNSQTTQRQHARQHIGRRTAERRLELIVNGGSEGVEANHGIQAVLRQKVQCDQQCTSPYWQAQLRQDNTEKDAQRRRA